MPAELSEILVRSAERCGCGRVGPKVVPRAQCRWPPITRRFSQARGLIGVPRLGVPEFGPPTQIISLLAPRNKNAAMLCPSVSGVEFQFMRPAVSHIPASYSRGWRLSQHRKGDDRAAAIN
jgi:hypothetical protein